MLNLREMLVGDLTRLRYVDRFSTCHKVHNENVAEHSYYVAIYALLIGTELNFDLPAHKRLNIGVLMQKALIHDIEECITGDINRLFKHSTPAITAAIDAGSRTAVWKLFTDMAVTPDHHVTWKNAKDDTYEGRLVKFCDYLAVLAYMVQELTNANITMHQHWKTMWDYQQIFADDDFDFVRASVNTAKEILYDAFGKSELG